MDQIKFQQQLMKKRDDAEKALLDAFDQLSKLEYEKEKVKQTHQGKTAQKELVRYREILAEIQRKNAEEEKRLNDLLNEYRLELQKRQDEARCKLVEARRKLQKVIILIKEFYYQRCFSIRDFYISIFNILPLYANCYLIYSRRAHIEIQVSPDIPCHVTFFHVNIPINNYHLITNFFKDVLEIRAGQLEYKRLEAEQQLKAKQAENEMARIAIEENRRYAEEAARLKLLATLEYRDDLTKQIEDSNVIKVV